MIKLPFIICAVLVSVSGIAQEAIDIEKYREASTEKWEVDIREMEERDKTEKHPDNSILFIGSSSIRMWDNIANDMDPYHPIQRGFGGSKFSDLAIFADRLITPHKFRAVVLFVGNDIAGKEDDKTPEEVAALFSYFLGKIRAHNPDAPVFYIGVTPTAARIDAWKQVRAANSAIREICLKSDGAHFIGTESIFLDGEGNPRTELFISDKLHLNETGYDLWSAAIRSQLDSVLNGAK